MLIWVDLDRPVRKRSCRALDGYMLWSKAGDQEMLPVFALHAVQVMIQQEAPRQTKLPTIAVEPLPPSAEGKPLAKPKRRFFDTGWWTRAQAAAMVYDGASTSYWEHKCPSSGVPWCTERDPAARWLIGARPSVWRMGLVGSAIVAATAMIPNKKVRRLAQIAMIVMHIEEGTRNFARQY